MDQHDRAAADGRANTSTGGSLQSFALIHRRRLLAGAGGALLLSGLPACDGGAQDEAAAATTGGTPLLVTADIGGLVDAKQIGGANLATRSAYRDSAIVDAAGAFTTTVSQEGAQMLVVTDGARQVRGLAVSLPGISPRIDAASTALTLLFMTPGILTTTPAEAVAALDILQGLASFAALSQYLAQNLPKSSLAVLAGGTQLEALKAACIAEYQTVRASKLATTARFRNQADPSGGQVDAAFTNAVGTAAQVTLSNYAFRYVSVIREELSVLGLPIGLSALPNLTGTTNPTISANVLNGVNTLSWANLYAVGPGSVGSGLDKPPIDLVAHPDLGSLRYWSCGPGRSTGSETFPDAPKLEQFGDAAFGASILFYVVFPLTDFATGSLALNASDNHFQDIALTMWAGSSKFINAFNLITAWQSWTPENLGGAQNVELAAADLTISLVSVVIGGKAGPLTEELLANPALANKFQKANLVLAFMQAFFGASNLGLAVTSWASAPLLDMTTLPLKLDGYTVQAIGKPGGPQPLVLQLSPGNGRVMNDKGQVVGVLSQGGGNTIGLYGGGKVTDIGGIATADGMEMGVPSINTSGQIVANYGIHDIALYKNGAFESLTGKLPGTRGFGGVVNDAGQVAGSYFEPGDRNLQCYIYDFASTPTSLTQLGQPPGALSTKVVDFNNAGQVLGVSIAPGTAGIAFVYDHGVFLDLRSVVNPGPVTAGFSITPVAINNKGAVLGIQFDFSIGVRRNFVYRPGKGVEFISVAPDQFFIPVAMNDAGDILGNQSNISGTSGNIASLYSGGVFVDLTTLVPGGSLGDFKLSGGAYAIALNNSGQILLKGGNDAGFFFILTPKTAPNA
jgi:hypothetical protein